MDRPETVAPTTRRVDPFLVSVLKSRFEAIVREMSNVVMKASRSAVIKNAKDLSCTILTFDHRIVTAEDALPIHVTAMDICTRPITRLFADIKPGDIYLNNCPFTGGTHHADMILCMPVFAGEEPLFWVVALSHHADTGAPIPTTYLPFAKNVYEEGIQFPCVRLVENGQIRQDILRIGLNRIRVPEMWHGDLMAQIGACRTGERRIRELLERYGRDTVMSFVEDWFDYGERRMIAEIAKLPAGTYTYETRHDPVPGVADDGVPVRLHVTIDPKAGFITVDATDNVDCVPGGLNLSENTCTSSCRIGIFNNLDHTLPHNHGSISRIRVRLREGSAVGKPTHPTGTSVATTNVNDRLILAGTCVFSEIGPTYGQAECGCHLPLGMAVVSGADPFRDGQPYVNQVFVGYSGGGAPHGHDGWLTYCGPANGGLIVLDSIEVDESMYPFVIGSREVCPDSQGFGEWEGAPGVSGTFYPLEHDLTAIYAADGTTFPPRGVNGGTDAKPVTSQKRLADGKVIDLPAFNEEVCRAGEELRFHAAGGGGYGDPLRRPAERVVATVNRGWLTPETAREVYRVALDFDPDEDEWQINPTATERLRGGEGTSGSATAS